MVACCRYQSSSSHLHPPWALNTICCHVDLFWSTGNTLFLRKDTRRPYSWFFGAGGKSKVVLKFRHGSPPPKQQKSKGHTGGDKSTNMNRSQKSKSHPPHSENPLNVVAVFLRPGPPAAFLRAFEALGSLPGFLSLVGSDWATAFLGTFCPAPPKRPRFLGLPFPCFRQSYHRFSLQGSGSPPPGRMRRMPSCPAPGVREVQRTMLELLNQLDGFTNQTTVKIIAATNRPLAGRFGCETKKGPRRPFFCSFAERTMLRFTVWKHSLLQESGIF